jgi:hypothetical protein
MFAVTTSPVDAASLVHQVAIIGEYEHPETLDWFTGVYVSDEVQVLVRASTDAPAGGQITLDVGRWRVWWKSDANPEYPARQVGIVSVV